MNNADFRMTIENVKKHRDIKLVTTEKRKNYLVSETNYHTTKFISENLLAIEMKKTEIHMNKPVHLGMSIPNLQSKTQCVGFFTPTYKTKRTTDGSLLF